MNLLDLAKAVSETAKDSKRELVAEHSHDAGCPCPAELVTQIQVVRGGLTEVQMSCDDGAVATAYKLAATIFSAEQIALVMDGTSIIGRQQIVSIATDRLGGMRWVVQPYQQSSIEVSFPSAEVPADCPIVSESVIADMLDWMRDPPFEFSPVLLAAAGLPGVGPRLRAEMDMLTCRNLKTNGSMGITGIRLVALEGTERGAALQSSSVAVVLPSV